MTSLATRERHGSPTTNLTLRTQLMRLLLLTVPELGVDMRRPWECRLKRSCENVFAYFYSCNLSVFNVFKIHFSIKKRLHKCTPEDDCESKTGAG